MITDCVREIASRSVTRGCNQQYKLCSGKGGNPVQVEFVDSLAV
jgi:hypothetical protein